MKTANKQLPSEIRVTVDPKIYLRHPQKWGIAKFEPEEFYDQLLREGKISDFDEKYSQPVFGLFAIGAEMVEYEGVTYMKVSDKACFEESPSKYKTPVRELIYQMKKSKK